MMGLFSCSMCRMMGNVTMTSTKECNVAIRPARLTTILVILISLEPASLFALPTKSVASRRRAEGRDGKLHPLSAAPTTGNDDNPLSTSLEIDEGQPTNGMTKRSVKSRERKKKVDFPSFAYDTKNRYRTSRQHVRVCFDNFEDRATSRVIVVPRSEKKKGRPFYYNLLRAVFGRSFEAIFSDTEQLLPTAVQTRLLTERAYARQEPFAAENMTLPPSLDDLAARNREPFEGFWISTPARILLFSASFISFPVLTKFLDVFVTMEPEQLDEIASKFAPGISILYGTFISLTLSILYNRQRDIQDNVALECALLIDITRTLLSLFSDFRDKAVEAGQCAADQIRTLVRSSRGAELMLLMYNDPYARMLELVDTLEDELYLQTGGAARFNTRIAYSRDIIKDLYKVRAQRLSDESLALPPTHFLILNTLTALILLGYTISILPTVNASTGEPSNESSLLFGVLTTTYIIFYYFASDLNNPFRGVYQLRRSCAASHLLEAKWLIANHPLLRGQVDFEDVEDEDDGSSILEMRSPGLGDYYFVRDDLMAGLSPPSTSSTDGLG